MARVVIGSKGRAACGRTDAQQESTHVQPGEDDLVAGRLRRAWDERDESHGQRAGKEPHEAVRALAAGDDARVGARQRRHEDCLEFAVAVSGFMQDLSWAMPPCVLDSMPVAGRFSNAQRQ